MRHPLDRPVASDFSQLVLEKRRRESQLGLQTLDSCNQRLYPLPSQMVQREAFIADRPNIPDSFQGDVLTFWPEGK